MSEAGEKIAIFSSNDNHVVVEALKKYFDLFDYSIVTENPGEGTEIKNIEDDILVYLNTIDYHSLTDIDIFKNATIDNKKFNCLNLIQNRLDFGKSITLVTQNCNDYFPSLCVSPFDLIKYFRGTRIPSFDENIGAIFKVFKDHPNHTVDYIEQHLDFSNNPCQVSVANKTVLIVDDFLCNSKTALGWFFMENLNKYGLENKMRFLFTTTPSDFFQKLHDEIVDIVFVDLDYSQWEKSPDSYELQSVYYMLQGINRVGWRIIEKLITEHVKGREHKKTVIFSLLPQIVVFSHHEIKALEENIIEVKDKKEKYKINNYKMENGVLRYKDINDNFEISLLICPKADDNATEKLLKTLWEYGLSDDIFLSSDLEISGWNRKELLYLRRALKTQRSDCFRYPFEGITIDINTMWINDENIDERQVDIMGRIATYKKEINKFTGDIKLKEIREDSEWKYKEGENPYKGIDYSKTRISGASSIRNKSVSFCGIKLDNPILLAATPLTAIQHYEKDKINEWYHDKIRMLLSTGVGGIVLKTVYYNLDDHYSESKQEKMEPYVSIQDKSKSRVFFKYSYKDKQIKNPKGKKVNYIADSLYNTGDTKTENLTFIDMINFLRNYKELQTERIIISIGSKSYEPVIWKKMLQGLSTIKNPLIEINARHVIREMLREEDMLELFDEYVIYGKDYTLFYDNFKKWLSCVHNFAVNAKKKLIIKLPFRSDLVQLIQFCDIKAGKHPHYGIKAITLINTVKAPYPLTRKEMGGEFIPAYLYPDHDVFGIPQLSGNALKFIRDWGIFQASRYVRNVDISASGGVDRIEDVNACLSMGAKTVQLGTSLLIHGINKIENILDGEQVTYIHPLNNLLNKNKGFVKRFARVDKSKCFRCGSCLKSYYCDAFENRYSGEVQRKILEDLKTEAKSKEVVSIPLKSPVPSIDETLCHGCGLCAQVCEYDAIFIVPKEKG